MAASPGLPEPLLLPFPRDTQIGFDSLNFISLTFRACSRKYLPSASQAPTLRRSNPSSSPCCFACCTPWPPTLGPPSIPTSTARTPGRQQIMSRAWPLGARHSTRPMSQIQEKPHAGPPGVSQPWAASTQQSRRVCAVTSDEQKRAGLPLPLHRPYRYKRNRNASSALSS